jgi:predicted alpha/beta hydrolase family esterase
LSGFGTELADRFVLVAACHSLCVSARAKTSVRDQPGAVAGILIVATITVPNRMRDTKGSQRLFGGRPSNLVIINDEVGHCAS